MSAHEQFAEDLALYALGSLQGEERTTLETHLESCPSCRLELDQLRGDMALMAMAVDGPHPPQRSRQRLLDAIQKEPGRKALPAAEPKRGWSLWSGLGWLAAAAMLLITFQTRRENSALRQSLASLGALVGQQTIEIENARRVIEPLTSPSAQRVVLLAAKTPPQPQGKAFYLRDKTGLVFVANNLPPLAPEKIYELWLIPKTGAPIAAGLFKPDAQGSATVVNPPLPAGVEAKNFVVTLEPDSGSHEAPRGTAVMAGAGE
jgi:anti-sigma-K factor RskA